MAEEIKKVVIGVPNEGITKSEAYDNHLELMFHLGRMQEIWKTEKRTPRYEFYFHTVGRLLTPYAREKLTESALAIGADYMVQFDDDMILPVDMVECMLQDMENQSEIDVLGALAFMRNAPHFPVMYTTTEGYDPVHRTPYYIREIVKKYPKDTMVECDAVGFGAVCIRMDILKKMKAPYFMSTTQSGEDIYFCYKAKKAGARIFMDTRIKLGHLSNPFSIDEAYYEKYAKEHDIEIPDIPVKYNV
jgi:GT2 family glycosyltransferase